MILQNNHFHNFAEIPSKSIKIDFFPQNIEKYFFQTGKEKWIVWLRDPRPPLSRNCPEETAQAEEASLLITRGVPVEKDSSFPNTAGDVEPP